MSSVPTDVSDTRPLPGPVRIDYGRTDRSPSGAIVEALADLVGVDPGALADEAGFVLYDHVDPDALDALVAHRSGGEFSVSFSVGEYVVRVDRDAVVARVAE